MRAADSDYHVRRYRVHEGCPSQASFQARVEARATAARAVAPDQPGHEFSVVVERDGDQSQGQIQLSSDPSDIRSVTGTDCAEVIDALALIAAVTVDPYSALGPGSASGPLPEAATPENQPASDKPPAAPPQPASALQPAPALSPAALLLRAALRGRIFLGVGPTPLFGGGVLFGRGPDRTWPFELRIALDYAQSARVDRGPGSVRTRYTGAELELCPLLVASAPVHLSACGAFQAGVRSADGDGVDQPKTATDPWISLGPSAHVELRPLDWVFVELGGGAGFPLVRQDLVFERPAHVAYETPVIAGDLQLGLGLLFP